MIIKWFGQTAIQIKSKNRIVVVDPFSSKTGLDMPNLRADILAVTKKSDLIDRSKVKNRKKADLFTIDYPGEYEVNGVMVTGVKAKNNLTIYNFFSENISVAHLGTINQKELSEKQVDQLGKVDILFLPVGNKDGTDSEQAIEIAQQLEPRIIVPFYYQIAGLKNKLDPVDKFLKDEGVKDIEPEEEINISYSQLPSEEETKIITLKPASK
jgi:L-ascorbate metabolism protein UlaG (beta-lactamase superfamily)